MNLITSIFIICCAIISVQAECLNDCSGHGKCQNNYCECNEDSIGYDCSREAHPLKKGDYQSEHGNGTYYIQHIFADKNPTTQKLYIQNDGQELCRVSVLISKLGQLTFEFYVTTSLASEQSFSLVLEPEFQMIGNTLLIKINSEGNSALIISLGNNEVEEDIFAFSGTQIMVITLPIGAVVIIVIIFLCYFRRIKRIWLQRYSKTTIPQTSRQDPMYLEQRYIATQQINDPQQQISLYSPNEECSICLQSLSNMPVVITPCLHKFHGNCILEVLMRQQSCPNCRAYLQSNQLIGINQPNQFQAQLV